MATSLQDIIDRAKQKMNQANKERTVKPGDGKSVWRVLPGWDKSEPNMFFHPFGQHYIKDMDGKIKAVIVCQEKTFDLPCEVCDAIADAMKAASSDELREKIGEAKSSQRYLMNAIQVDKDKEKVVILEVGTMLLNGIFAQLEEYSNLLDPEKGNDIIITREGTGLNTKYSITVRSAEKSITVPKSAMLSINNLSDYVKEDSEAKKLKALEALGLMTGTFVKGSAAAAALAAPDADYSGIDDEVPDFDARAEAEKELAAVEDAEVVSDSKDAAPSDEEFGAEIEDEDIEAMLAALN